MTGEAATDHSTTLSVDERRELEALRLELAEARQQQAATARELQVSRGYQTAMSEVLAIISRSPMNLQHALDTIIEAAARLAHGDKANLRDVRDNPFRIAASWGFSPEERSFAERNAYPPPPGTLMQRIMTEKRTIHAPDAMADPALARMAAGVGVATTLGVPLMRNGNLIGTFFIGRILQRPFTEREIALVEAFANQAVIAIENARLFEAEQTRTKELKESLEYQTAISEVLAIISKSPRDLNPVLETILNTAGRLCGCERGGLWMLEGDQFIYTAHMAASPPQIVDYFRQNPQSIRSGKFFRRAVVEKRAIQIADAMAEPDSTSAPELIRKTGPRTMLAVPLLGRSSVIGVINLVRYEVCPFTPRQVSLVETFADQAVIAIENARLFEAEQARTMEVEAKSDELVQTLEYQTAISNVLGVISRSTKDAQPVFETVVENAVRLCGASFCNMIMHDGARLHMVASHNLNPTVMAMARAKYPMVPDRSQISSRAFLSQQTERVSDILMDSEYPSSMARAGGWRAMVGVPLMRQGAAIGAIVMGRPEPRPFSDREVRLVETFADQAVIAIENARLFDAEQMRTREVIAKSEELAQSLEYQTAISAVLGVISRSPTNLQPVFETIATNATRLCGAKWTAVNQFDGEIIRLVAIDNMIDPSEREVVQRLFPRKPTPGGAVDNAILSREVAYLRHLGYETGFPHATSAAATGARCIVAVPMLRAGVPIGTISVTSGTPDSFSQQQIDLLKSFADQAVIAINNVGLFEDVQARTKEVIEALEYQTATSDVLSVISRSPNELQPVLDAILSTACRLCKTNDAYLGLVRGEWLEQAAYHGTARPDGIERLRLDPRLVATRAISDRKPVHIHDLAADDGEFSLGRDLALKRGHRTVLAIPLLSENKGVGCIFLRRTSVQPFTQRQIALLQTFADQAVIATNNARLFGEVQARTKEVTEALEYQTATAEVLGVISKSPNDLQPVLDAILDTASRLCECERAGLWMLRDDEFHLTTSTSATPPEIVKILNGSPISIKRESAALIVDVAKSKRAIQVPDIVADSRYSSGKRLNLAGARSIVAAPLMSDGNAIGVIIVVRTEVRPFTNKQMAMLETFASQAVIAINNARLFNEITEKGEQLRIASQHKSQFVANMSHELRTPLAAMLGYAELLRDGAFGELPEKSIRIIDRVQVNGKHLLGLINTVLDISKIEAGQFSLNLDEYSLTSLIETVRVGTESLASEKKLALVTDVTSGLPRGYGDEQRLAQVLLNLVGNAIKFTDRGEVRIIARAEEGQFHLTVRDTGPGIPPDEQERIFEEFHQVDNSSTRAKGGTGLGLTIARRIVQMHGGSIRVKSKAGEGAAFHLRLPVQTPKL